ncbi:sigma 54-interacting transcriptional regulator [Desulfosoma caldarium]|uniref:Two-component system response regulator HydG n=1 Tax=Desulfosoma caldarium TaxID=610254 RepID=A0A3N1UNR8_9BACT|nr:sigma 54-interacting transcriptional regulator [Desulfosoma caldarium]ROQ91039.1 two-component system response regulator HydG [Desulfosoma caldarium]
MAWNRLSTKLLAGAIGLVLLSALAVASLATFRYSQSLMESLRTQSSLLGHSLAVEATNLVLTNDLVGLQKMIQHQKAIHDDLAYLFVVKDGRILVHSFDGGFPTNLLHVHRAQEPQTFGVQEVISETGERYLDIAVPIFEGRAGCLRLGFTENAYQSQMRRLWVEIGGITATIVLMAVGAISLVVKKLLSPLDRLTHAVERASQGELTVRVDDSGDREVAVLAQSFNLMMERLEDYTHRLQQQAQDLAAAQQRTRAFCEIVQNIGALHSLQDIGAFLISRFRDVLHFDKAALLLFDDARETLIILDDKRLKTTGNPRALGWFAHLLDTVKTVGVRSALHPAPPEPVLDALWSERVACALVPISTEAPSAFGTLIIRCDDRCHCPSEALELIGAIIREASGVLQRAVAHEMEMRSMQRLSNPRATFCGMVGRDPAMQNVFRLVENVAASDATVLIQGESGTGKELVAQAIHQLSPRSSFPFVIINCAAYPPSLIESELFGHEKGAFTGADRARQGRFEQAEGGTVFLDEVGDIPAPVQVKLLRVLQTHQFERVGGEKTLQANVRVVAATHRHLLKEVKNGRFREDLFYRLNVIPITLPPLRSRPMDIPLLATHFLQKYQQIYRKDVKDFHRDVLRLFVEYSWPGNVRELENTVEHAVLMSKNDTIHVWDLPSAFRSTSTVAAPEGLATMEERERQAIAEALESAHGNKKKAAQKLGISRSALYNKMKKYGFMS